MSVDVLLAVRKNKKNQINTKFKTENVRKIKKEPITMRLCAEFSCPTVCTCCSWYKNKSNGKITKKSQLQDEIQTSTETNSRTIQKRSQSHDEI